MAIELVLRDFDGSRTIYPTDPPLPEKIVLRVFDASRTIYPTDPPLREMSVEGRIYAKTDETDDQGRVIYTEQE